jgi:hypothetical protein
MASSSPVVPRPSPPDQSAGWRRGDGVRHAELVVLGDDDPLGIGRARGHAGRDHVVGFGDNATSAVRQSERRSFRPKGSSPGVISNFPVTATNGFSNLPEFSGSGDGVLGVACTGATPRSGNLIPGQVVTELRTDLTYLRIIRNDGAAITGTVRINCVLEVEATPEGTAALERLQHAVR